DNRHRSRPYKTRRRQSLSKPGGRLVYLNTDTRYIHSGDNSPSLHNDTGWGNLHLVTRDTQVFKLHTRRQSHQEGGLLEAPPTKLIHINTYIP
ncbi:unnamed protein product, partial [Staurois parvus]